MAVSCDPNDLLALAKCMDCVPDGMASGVAIYLLATIAGVSTDPSTLMQNALCMDCVPEGMEEGVAIVLLCAIANR